MTIFMPIFNQIREKKISISVFIRGIFDPFLWRAFFGLWEKNQKKGSVRHPVQSNLIDSNRKFGSIVSCFWDRHMHCDIFRCVPYIPITTVLSYFLGFEVLFWAYFGSFSGDQNPTKNPSDPDQVRSCSLFLSCRKNQD